MIVLESHGRRGSRPVLKPRVEVEYAWIRMVVLLSFMYDYANFALASNECKQTP